MVFIFLILLFFSLPLSVSHTHIHTGCVMWWEDLGRFGSCWFLGAAPAWWLDPHSATWFVWPGLIAVMAIWLCLEIERAGVGWGWEGVTEEEKEFLLRGRLARDDQEFLCVCVCMYICMCVNGAFCSNVTHRVLATVGAWRESWREGERHTRERVDVVKSLGDCMFSCYVKLWPTSLMNQYTKCLPVKGTHIQSKSRSVFWFAWLQIILTFSQLLHRLCALAWLKVTLMQHQSDQMVHVISHCCL